jgi:VanZ family protein
MRSDLHLQTLWAAGGWAMIATVIVLCLLPAPMIAPVASLLPDKAEHAIAFLAMTLWFCGLYRRGSWLKIAAGFLVLGGAIEVAQGVFTTTRTMDFNDWLAECAGIAVALLLSRWGLGNWSAFIETRIFGLGRE